MDPSSSYNIVEDNVVENSDHDVLLSTLPIHYSNALSPNTQLHQFPLLTRPLQVPPSASLAGKRIRVRVKPKSSRIEVHVPVDTRPEVWNRDRSRELGQARVRDDVENGGVGAGLKKMKEKEMGDGDGSRLGEVRMQSERVSGKGVYMLGVVRDGKLYLHPITQTHQFRPSLTYMDILSKPNNRTGADSTDSDSSNDNDDNDRDQDDAGPSSSSAYVLPPSTAPASSQKSSTRKSSKSGSAKATADMKEIQVSIKRMDEKGNQVVQGGLTNVRREMLEMIRNEEEEKWEDVEYCDVEAEGTAETFEAVFSKKETELICKTRMEDVLNGSLAL